MKRGKHIAFFCLLLMTFHVMAQGSLPPDRSDWRSLLKIARKNYAEKDYQNALLYYKTALPNLPDTLDISREIAQTQYRLNQLEAADEIYQKKIKSELNNSNELNYNAGNVAMKKQDFDRAIEHYKAALKANPKDQEARYNLSEALRQKQQQKQNPQQSQSNNTPKKPSSKDQNKQENENKSQLNQRSVDRMLDKVMKQEAQTKRKIANGKEGPASNNNGIDW